MGDVSKSAGLPPGTVIDNRYEIVDFIGAGGFAMVYRARHIHMQREVALKLLNISPHFPQRAEFEERFIREAQIAAQLRHPSIVTTHDFGFTPQERIPYLAMELLRGHELQQEIGEGPVSPARALPLFVECLHALAEAHDAGIVHKDLKPANLFLVGLGTPREALKVLDFGVARVTSDAKVTKSGQVFGTPQYLAPEYITRQHVSPALDVYQMGLILVEALTGHAVVQGSNPFACADIHARGALDLPVDLLESPLGPVLRRALAVDPAERYPHARDFAKALQAIDPATVTVVADGRMAEGAATTRMDTPVPSGELVPAPSGSGPVDHGAGTVGLQRPVSPEPHVVPASRSALPWIGVALGAVAAVLVVVVWFVVGGGRTIDATRAGEVPIGTAPAVPVSSVGAVTVEPAAPLAEGDEGEPVVEEVEITLDTTPSGALVLHGGVEVGRTPMTWKISPSEVEASLRFELEGHEPYEVVVPRDRSGHHVFALERRSVRAARRVPTLARRGGQAASALPPPKPPADESSSRTPPRVNLGDFK